MKKNSTCLLVGILVVAGMIGSSFMLSRLLVRLEKESELMVKGYAERNIKAERGRFTVNLSVSHKALSEAYKRLNISTDMLLGKIKESGFKDNEISVANVQLNKINQKNQGGKETNEIDFYQLVLPVTVNSVNVDLIEKKHKTINTLLLEGIEVQVCNPEYYINNVDAYKMELLSMATQNGYERAKLIAGSSGGKIKKLISAKQGVFQITTPDSSDISDYGIYDTSSINKNAKIVVTLKYRLE